MKNLRYLIVIAFIIGSAAGAHASSLCHFDSRCVEDQPCEQVNLELRFRAGTGGPNELEIVTATETVGVAVGGTGKMAYLAGLGENGFHVLSVAAGSGRARYSRHMAEGGPVAETWLGQCEVNR